jgi:O-antigen/teichoic acid export membrane protein
MSLFRDTSLSAVSSVVAVGGRAVVTILLARGLAPTIYGEFVFLQWLIELFSLICSFGLAGSMTRFFPGLSKAQSPSHSRVLGYFGRLVAISIALSTALFAAYLAYSQALDAYGYAVFIAWSIVSASSGFLGSALQGFFRYDAATVGNAVSVTVAALLAISFPPSLIHAALVMTLSYAAGIAASLGLLKLCPKPQRLSLSSTPPDLSAITTYAANVWLTALISGLVWSRGEFAILKLYVQSREIALYSTALSLSGTISQGAGLLTGALTPHMAGHSIHGETHHLETILQGVTQAVLMFTSAVAILLIATGSDIIPALLGAAYRGSYDVLCLLAVSTVSISSGCANTLLQIETSGRFGRNSNALALAVLLIASAMLTPFIGIMGGAIARLAAQMTVALYIFWRLSRIGSFRAVAERLFRAFIFTMTIVVLFYLFVKYGSDSEVMTLGVAFAGIACVIVTTKRIIGQRMLAIIAL